METIVIEGVGANPGTLGYIFHWLKVARVRGEVRVSNNRIEVTLPILEVPNLRTYLSRQLPNTD